MKDATKHPFSSRTWFDFPFLKSVPVEPLCKVVFTFIGINGELWFGHESYRYVLASTSSNAIVAERALGHESSFLQLLVLRFAL